MSSSSSSSWSSSTKPPSEKIGVRSSCEAFAMNSLRAPSTRASCCLHLVERARELAELVLGVDGQRLDEVAGGDVARRRARAAARGAPSALRHEVAADQREQAARRRVASSTRSRTKADGLGARRRSRASRAPPSGSCRRWSAAGRPSRAPRRGTVPYPACLRRRDERAPASWLVERDLRRCLA